MRLTIRTDRLTLRPFDQADAVHVAALVNNMKIARMVARIPHPYSVAMAERWISEHAQSREIGFDYPFALIHEGRLVGSAGCALLPTGEGALSPQGMEIGYWIGEPFWGQGFATEAARAVTTFGFEDLGENRLHAGYFADNPASARVLQKLGFQETGEVQRWCEARGHHVRCITVARDAAGWPGEAA